MGAFTARDMAEKLVSQTEITEEGRRSLRDLLISLLEDHYRRTPTALNHMYNQWDIVDEERAWV